MPCQGLFCVPEVMDVLCVCSWIPSQPGSVGISRPHQLISSWHDVNWQSVIQHSLAAGSPGAGAASKLLESYGWLWSSRLATPLCGHVPHGFGTSQPPHGVMAAWPAVYAEMRAAALSRLWNESRSMWRSALCRFE